MLPATLPQFDPKHLYRRLARLRWRLRSIALLRGIGALGAWLIGCVLLVGALDFSLQLPALVRALALVGILVGSAWIIARWLLQPLTTPVDNFHLALRLEEHYPELNDALASAIQFMEQPWEDEETSSPLLRRVTVRRAVRLAEECDFAELVSLRGLFIAGWAFVLTLAVAVPLARFAPNATTIALTRLLVPFSRMEWPASTSLRVLSPKAWPHRHPLGEPLEIHVQVEGRIPERATLSLWFEGTPPIESTWLVSDEGELVVRLEASRIPRDFRFRVRANDGSTPWHEVQVLPPPELVPLNGRASPQLRLEYPRYTDLPPRQLPDGATSFEAVAGTNVLLRAAVSRPMARAWVVYRPEQPIDIISAGLLPLGVGNDLGGLLSHAVGRSVWEPVPARLGRDGTELEVFFTPRLPGVYALRFEEETGFGATRMIDARIIPDPAPSVVLERPSASFDSLNVTPHAEIPLRALIHDPTFAIRSAWLEYRTAKDAPARSRCLYDHSVVGRGLAVLGQLPPLRLRMPQVFVDGRLRLADFRHPDGSPLKENDALFLQIAADDFDDVTGQKAPGRSHEIELRIVSEASLEAMLHREQANVRGQLLRLQQWQREARDKVADAKAQKDATGQLRPEDLEKLIQAEQLQQQIRNRVGDEKEGLRAEVNRIRNAMQENKLPPSAAQNRMDAVASELERLARDELSTLEPLLNAARERVAASPSSDPKPEENSPPRAESEPRSAKIPEDKAQRPKGQSASIQPKQASSRRSDTEPLAEALKRQRNVEQSLEQLLQRLESWSGANEVRSETRSLLDEQRRMTQQTEQLDQQIEKARRDLLPPEQQAELDRAAGRQESLANQLSQLVEKMERLSKEKASQEQERREAAERLAQKAQEKEKELSGGGDPSPSLKSEAERLRQETDELREAADRLKREAEALADAARMAREQLEQDSGIAPPQTKLHQAAREIKENKLGNAARRQQEAAQSLQRLLDRLEERRSDDLDRLAKKLREAEDRLDDLVDQQERLQKKTQEAQQLANPEARQAELERLAREQEQLREEARDLLEELSRLRADSAAQALNRAARSMEDSRRRLERGASADESQEDTLDKLDQAQDQLEQQRQLVEEELAREKLAKVSDRIRAIRDRQQSLNREMKRIHQTALETKAWDRPLLQSLNDQADLERGLADELDHLIDGPYKSIRVAAKMLGHATEAMRLAAERIEARLEDIKVAQDQNEPFDTVQEEKLHASIVRWQETAVRRIDQLLDALKPDKDLARSGGGAGQAGGNGPGQTGSARAGAGGEDVPLLAQLKALRALQAEVNNRTAQFAKEHPDLSKLTDDEQAELRLLRRMQGDIVELLQEYGSLVEPTIPEEKR